MRKTATAAWNESLGFTKYPICHIFCSKCNLAKMRKAAKQENQ